MFVSKIQFVEFSKTAARLYLNAYEMHRFVMSAFPDGLTKDDRILFTVKENVVLVQSPVNPDWGKAHSKYGVIEDFETKEIQQKFNINDILRFELNANPVKCVNGKRLFIFDEDKQVEWLQSRGQMCGF